METNNNYPEITMNTANDYLTTKKAVGKFLGLGTILCLLGAIILTTTQLLLRDAQAVTLNKPNDLFIIGLVAMLIFLVAGVVLFIHGARLESPYEYIKKPFIMNSDVKKRLQNDWDVIKSNNRIVLIVGICLCALSPISTIIGALSRDEDRFALGFGVCSTLIIVAIAVYLIISAANILDAHNKLLEIENYSPEKKKARQ